MNNELPGKIYHKDTTNLNVFYTIYNSKKLEGGTIKTIGELKNFLKLQSDVNLWVDFLGTFDKEMLNNLAKILSIHPYRIE